jgi:hypothetical protein
MDQKNLNPSVENRRSRAQIEKLIVDLRRLRAGIYGESLETTIIADAASVLEILVERLDRLELTVERLVENQCDLVP